MFQASLKRSRVSGSRSNSLRRRMYMKVVPKKLDEACD
jgi:hypothetical protein